MLAFWRLRHGKSVAEREHHIERVSSLELSELACAVADAGDEQMKLVAVTIHIIYGYRTSEEGGL